MRGLYTFLTFAAALWAIPKSDGVELYVLYSHLDNVGGVSEWDSNGQLINDKLITGLNEPSALALAGNTLFVTVNSTSSTTAMVGKYEAATGKVINANFIRGLNNPNGLAESDNALFVAQGSNRVGKYDATTGGVINPSFISSRRNPSGALALLENKSSDKILFVAFGTTVGKYDATTGKVINSRFITGLDFPSALAVFGNTLFVANFNRAEIGAYDATTGAVINASFIIGFLDEPSALALSSNILFVANHGIGTIDAYDARTGGIVGISLIQLPYPFVNGMAANPGVSFFNRLP